MASPIPVPHIAYQDRFSAASAALALVAAAPVAIPSRDPLPPNRSSALDDDDIDISPLLDSPSITASQLSTHYLPTLLASRGAMAIRHIAGHLNSMIPGFAELPPQKQRRIITKALESRKGEKFEKIGWGRWAAIGVNGPTSSYTGGKNPQRQSSSLESQFIPDLMMSEDEEVPIEDEEDVDMVTDDEDWNRLGFWDHEVTRRKEETAAQALVILGTSIPSSSL
ncbi:Protein STB3 [Neolecta irregularis DAH-3]|uniref:Protein STB3 n=1 Tax=Neolecta irregularis (strain DAH-3) TaxID=1198029 RepID=A0A1U7LV14_NEOID|nr:Protein STB3 [Neolecta irregularis DAH-3]|eukprot:OLL26484.1 Protein STB3 [Neolecta irregularis DAH-3]